MNQKEIKEELKKLENDFIITSNYLMTKTQLIKRIQEIEKEWSQDFNKWDRIDITKIGSKYLLGDNCEPDEGLQLSEADN